MSLHDLIRTALNNLNEDHYKILRTIEKNLSRYEVVPLEIIVRQSGLDEESVRKLARKLNLLKLVWSPTGFVKGYVLNYRGLDILALKALSDRGVVESIGSPLGVGKEADVFDALSPGGDRLAVKFFRIGRTSFRDFGRKRSVLSSTHSYLLASMIAAKREFQALSILYPKGVSTPEPVAVERHVVVTKIFMGIELASAQFVKEPRRIFNKIIDNVLKAYDAGIVHGDLSVYNILVTPSEEIMIIDWPQWVDRDHPMAQTYLKRDLTNLMKYFKRKWNIVLERKEYQEVLDRMQGQTFNMGEDEFLVKGASG